MEGFPPPALPAPGPLNSPPPQHLPSLAVSPGQGRRWPLGLLAAGLRERGRLPCGPFAPGGATLKYFFPPLTGTSFWSFNALLLSPREQEHIQIFTIKSDSSPRSSEDEEPYTEDVFLVKSQRDSSDPA